jgi:hypothetical protein
MVAMPSIYFLIDGQQQGPYSEEDVRQFIAEGRIQNDQLAWKEGLAEWVEVEGLLDGMTAPVNEEQVEAQAGPNSVVISNVGKKQPVSPLFERKWNAIFLLIGSIWELLYAGLRVENELITDHPWYMGIVLITWLLGGLYMVLFYITMACILDYALDTIRL